MIEIEEMALDTGTACDGRCEIRLLEKLQKAIGDILSEHTRGVAVSASSPVKAPVRSNGPRVAPSPPPLTNGYGLPTDDSAARPPARFADDAGTKASVVPSRVEAATIVVDTIAEITRYPREILTDEARFDDDLGVDSLKRAEIVAALLNRLGGTPPELKALGPMPLTVGEMTDFAVMYVTEWGATPAQQPPGTSGNTDVLGSPASIEPSVDGKGGFTTPSRDVPQLLRPSARWSKNPATDRQLEGKVALVTGSGEDLGKIIAEQMAQRGAHVITDSQHLSGRGEESSQEVLTGDRRSTHLWGSFANADHIERAFHKIEDRFDRLDYYVHCAVDEVITSLENATEIQWEKAFRSNVIAYQQCAIRAAKLMQKSGGGRIVALSSPGAKHYMKNYGVMGPVKAALESLTMYLAQDLALHNVQVNAVAACPAYGEQPRSLLSARDAHVSHPERGEGGLGHLEDVSEAVIFLLTTAARKINGSTMVVDGGRPQRI